MVEGGFELFVYFSKVLSCPNKSKEEKKYPTSRKLFKLFDGLQISMVDKVSLWPGCQEHDITVAPGQCGPQEHQLWLKVFQSWEEPGGAKGSAGSQLTSCSADTVASAHCAITSWRTVHVPCRILHLQSPSQVCGVRSIQVEAQRGRRWAGIQIQGQGQWVQQTARWVESGVRGAARGHLVDHQDN